MFWIKPLLMFDTLDLDTSAKKGNRADRLATHVESILTE